jgi:hypothetical protein
MPRKVFTSFHYKPDNWRASTVRNIGKIEGNAVVTPNKWEEVTRGGDTAIKKWINENMAGKSCVIVLVGENTAGRKWINYEIERAWSENRGVLGIYIHNLKNSQGLQSAVGENPFDSFELNGKKLSSVVKCYNPPYKKSTNVYKYISENIEDWIEKAIEIRKNN